MGVPCVCAFYELPLLVHMATVRQVNGTHYFRVNGIRLMRREDGGSLHGEEGDSIVGFR